MKEKFQIFSIIILMLLVSSCKSVKASDFNNILLSKYVSNYKELQQVNVDKNKEFIINFNKEINRLTINRNTIKIIDSKGQEVNVGILTRTDNYKVAIVRPQSEGFKDGETYALIITKAVLDINNKSLNQEIVMKFTIESEPIEKANKLFMKLVGYNIYDPLNIVEDSIKYYTSNYNQLPDKYFINVDEPIKISLDKHIDLKSVVNKVKVINMLGAEIPVKLSIDKNILVINAPQANYLPGEVHAIIIKKGITYLDGSKLENDIVMKFVTMPKAEKSADELYFKSLGNPVYHGGYFYKIVEDKLNFNYYYYDTKVNKSEYLSTSFNANINRQMIDTFKSLYTAKTGYYTTLDCYIDNNGSIGGYIGLDIDGATIDGSDFVGVNYYASSFNFSYLKGDYISGLSIGKCTKENFEKNKDQIKNALIPMLGENYSEELYNFIVAEYRKSLFDKVYVNNNDGSEYADMIGIKTFKNIKMNLFVHYNIGFSVDFAK